MHFRIEGFTKWGYVVQLSVSASVTGTKAELEEVEKEEAAEVFKSSLSSSDNELTDYVAHRSRSKWPGSDLLSH